MLKRPLYFAILSIHMKRELTKLNRNHLIFLIKWLKKPNRKPLILCGARQVGKSTLVRLFAEQQHRSLHEVNLEKYLELSDSFRQAPRELLNILETLPNMPPFNKEDSLLFFDEIQAVPAAIPALRYFYEEIHSLPLLAAGSLLEFALNDHRFSMPVGRVEYLHMGPMTFTEFLEALDEQKLSDFINNYQLNKKISPIIHNRLLALLRTYFFVGGMPEAINIYAQSRRLQAVSEVHHSSIET